jgi:hypothetical protein
MSNKTQLQNNNTALDGYIARINASKEVAAGLPEAGGGGGSASYDTCTLQINNPSGCPYQLAYTSVENGKIVAKYSNSDTPTSIICLCGSTLCCYKPGDLVSSSITHLGAIDGGFYYSEAYRIDASANETIIATIYEGGGGAN